MIKMAVSKMLALVGLVLLSICFTAKVSAQTCDCSFRPPEACEVVTLDTLNTPPTPSVCSRDTVECGGCHCEDGGLFTCAVTTASFFELINPEIPTSTECLESTQDIAQCPENTVVFACSNVDRVTWAPTFVCEVPGSILPAGATITASELVILQASNATLFLNNANSGPVTGVVSVTFINSLAPASFLTATWSNGQTVPVTRTLAPGEFQEFDVFQISETQQLPGNAQFASAMEAVAGTSNTVDFSFDVSFQSETADFQGGPVDLFSACVFLFAFQFSP
uniref:Uncharacterized protein n=1 Tax=Timspurckia oligopyrenoides TaxID=708627 RepID=A0A7S0ZFW5_9RHOD